MKYQGILFDLDGTLLDTLGDLADAVNAALAKHGFPLRTEDEVRSFVGNGIGKLIARAVPAGTDEQTVAACLADFRVDYAEHMNVRTKPLRGYPRPACVAEIRGNSGRCGLQQDRFCRQSPLWGTFWEFDRCGRRGM